MAKKYIYTFMQVEWEGWGDCQDTPLIIVDNKEEAIEEWMQIRKEILEKICEHGRRLAAEFDELDQYLLEDIERIVDRIEKLKPLEDIVFEGYGGDPCDLGFGNFFCVELRKTEKGKRLSKLGDLEYRY